MKKTGIDYYLLLFYTALMTVVLLGASTYIFGFVQFMKMWVSDFPWDQISIMNKISIIYCMLISGAVTGTYTIYAIYRWAKNEK